MIKNIAVVTSAMVSSIRENAATDTCTCEVCVDSRAGWDAGDKSVQELIRLMLTVTPVEACGMMDELMAAAARVDTFCTYNNSYQLSVIRHLTAGYEANDRYQRLGALLKQPERIVEDCGEDTGLLVDADPWLGDLNSLWGE